MRKLIKIFAAATFAASTATSAFAGPFMMGGFKFNQQQNSNFGIHLPAPQINQNIIRRVVCPDLQVSASQHDNADGTIAVQINVTNISSADYVSGAGQQMLVINGQNGGHSGTRRFTNLGSGASIGWTDTFQPFEFPATYNAYVAFDPDIRIDGNPQNDDCRSSNDQASLTTDR